MSPKEAYKLLGITPKTGVKKRLAIYNELIERANKRFEKALDNTERKTAYAEILKLEEALNVLSSDEEKSLQEELKPAIDEPGRDRRNSELGDSHEKTAKAVGSNKALRKPLKPKDSSPTENNASKPPTTKHRAINHDLKNQAWQKSTITEGTQGAALEKSMLKSLGKLTTLAAAIIVALLVWKFAVTEPRKAKKTFEAVTQSIQALPDLANDQSVSELEKRVQIYLINANETYSQRARELLDERIDSIKKNRAAEAIRLKQEKLALEKELKEKLKSLEQLSEWLSEENRMANSTLARINSQLSQESAAPQRGDIKAYLQARFNYYKDYQIWLQGYERNHPLKSNILNARHNLQVGKLASAEKDVDTGSKQSTALKELVRLKWRQIYGDRMLQWVQKPDNNSAISSLRKDDPDLIALIRGEIKGRLNYLDDRPGTTNSLLILEELAFFAGDNDPDYLRWKDSIMPDLKIETEPTGALVINSDNQIIGKTPYLEKDLLTTGTTYQLMRAGYTAESIKIVSRMNEDDHLVTLKMEPTANPSPNRNWQLKLDTGAASAIEFSFINSGTFVIGSPEQEKQRESHETQTEVHIERWYWMSQTEVTQAQWESVMGPSWRDRVASYAQDQFIAPQAPIHSIRWDEAVEFCRRITETERAAKRLAPYQRYTLPTHAQWEYACRAGTNTPFHFGKSLTADLANFNGRFPYASNNNGIYLQHPVAVASYAPNAWGLYDMHGNVWEWTLDDTKTPPKSDMNPSRRSGKICKGGSWFSNGGNSRSAKISSYAASSYENTLGFRMVIVSDAPLEIIQALREQLHPDTTN